VDNDRTLFVQAELPQSAEDFMKRDHGSLPIQVS
jgi:hypothetical protein